MFNEVCEFRNINKSSAAKLLEGNTQNRKIKKSAVSRYAADMRGGRWDEANCVPIVIDENGVIKDGQHRLRAVIEADATIRFLIISKVDESAHVYDRGIQRDAYDCAILKGCTDLAKRDYELVNRFFQRISKDYGIANYLNYYSTETIISYALNHKQEIMTATNIGYTNGANGKGLTRNSSYTATMYVMLRNGEDPEKLKRFTEIVNSGLYDNAKESAAIILRNQLYDMKVYKSTSGWSSMLIKCNIMERACDKFINGIPCKRKFGIDRYTKYTEKVLDMDSEEIKRYIGR